MLSGSTLLSEKRVKITLTRLCHQLIENHDDFSNTCVIGIQKRGAMLADRLVENLRNWNYSIEYGKLDITFYRDDFRKRATPLSASETIIDFIVEDKKVILVDDVLYTGRTVQAALTALQHYGRPKEVELLVLIDRRFNRQLPLEADYKGLVVDALDDAYVKVSWKEIDGEEGVKIFSAKSQ
jgi:pyrimidine operon attenuation protein/uracil phosphoribosyltransferase